MKNDIYGIFIRNDIKVNMVLRDYIRDLNLKCYSSSFVCYKKITTQKISIFLDICTPMKMNKIYIDLISEKFNVYYSEVNKNGDYYNYIFRIKTKDFKRLKFMKILIEKDLKIRTSKRTINKFNL